MTDPSDPADKPEKPTGAPEQAPTPEQPDAGGYPPPYPPNYGPGYPPPPPGAYPGAYPPAPPQPYAGYAPPPPAPKNGFGIAALICGLLSLPAAFTVFGGFILALIAIVLGIIGYRRAKRGEATNGGIAMGGVVLGILGIIVSAVLIAVGVWGFLKFGGNDLVDCLDRAGSDPAAQLDCQNQFTNNLEDRLSITLTPTP